MPSGGIDYSKWDRMTFSDDDDSSSSSSIKNDSPPGLQIPASLQERIVDKITYNRLTIIVGGTGCGVSRNVFSLSVDLMKSFSQNF